MRAKSLQRLIDQFESATSLTAHRDIDGVAATWRLRERQPKARIVILTTFDDEYVFEVLRARYLGHHFLQAYLGRSNGDLA